MKAVVVELNKNQAAVLSDDGCIVTIRNDNYEIGQVIQMKNQKLGLTKKLSVFAASAAAFVVLSVGTWAYASPYTYVSVDVNPSIEFIVNRFDRVIKVKAVNDDGEEILSEIPLNELTNESIENAIKTTVDQLSEAGYFNSEAEGGIVIATSSEDTEKAEELADELQTSVEEVNQENGDSVVVETISVGLERVKEAQELGVTPGKLNLVEKLQEAAGDTAEVDISEWLDKPVKDIMKATKDYKKAPEDANADNSEDADNIDTGEADNDITVTSEDQDQADSQNDDKEGKELQKEEDKAAKESVKEQKDAVKDQKQTVKEEDKSKTSKDKSTKSDKKDKDSAATTDKDAVALNDNSSGKKSEQGQDTDQSTDKNSSDTKEKKDQPTKDEDKKAQQNEVNDVPSNDDSNITDQTPGTGTDSGNSNSSGSENETSSQGSAGSDNSSHASDNPGKTDTGAPGRAGGKN